MTFNEIYDELLTYEPELPMYDAMNLINSAISELNSKNFVQEQELDFDVDDGFFTFSLRRDKTQSSDLNVQVVKVLKITNDSGIVMSRRGVGNEYVRNFSTSDYVSYNQIGYTVYVEESDGDQTYHVQCYTTLPKFDWQDGTPAFITGDDASNIKDSFRSAIRYLALSYFYKIDKFGEIDMDNAAKYEERAQKAISNLLKNEIQYKEKV